MTIYYSPSLRGFFDSTITTVSIPSDGIEIESTYRDELLKMQGQGGSIVPDDTGRPVLVMPNTEQINLDLSKNVRAQRNTLLVNSDWTELPSVQLAHSNDTNWISSWATYRQALRDLPTQTGFPNTINWPNPPQ